MYDDKAARIKGIGSVFLDLTGVFLISMSFLVGIAQFHRESCFMFCAIYKSTKKNSTYLYINKKDSFEDVPTALLNVFGKPQFVMVMDLDKREKLASVNIDKVKGSLLSAGYFLQMPPRLDIELQYIRDKNTKL